MRENGLSGSIGQKKPAAPNLMLHYILPLPYNTFPSFI